MITEPTTMTTDYLVAACSIAWAILLWRGSGRSAAAARWWALGFGAAAVAALAGGTVHGFRLALSSPAEAALWRATLYAVGAFGFCAIATALTAGYDAPA